MKKINPQILGNTHIDFSVIDHVSNQLYRNKPDFIKELPELFRNVVNQVIDTERTGRTKVDELEKTEKTYIGTKIEILVRNYFGFTKGKLDLVIDGRDVDVKNTIGNTWMIPREAIDQPCLLIATDDRKNFCYFGLIVAHLSNLTKSTNQDLKRSVSAEGFKNIHWFFSDKSF